MLIESRASLRLRRVCDFIEDSRFFRAKIVCFQRRNFRKIKKVTNSQGRPRPAERARRPFLHLSATEGFAQSPIRRFRHIISIKRQGSTACLLRVRANPGVFVCESPGLDGGATAMSQARRGDGAINVGLSVAHLLGPHCRWRRRAGDVHFSDVDLNSKCRKAPDVG